MIGAASAEAAIKRLQGSLRFRLALSTFVILALALALTRWISEQIRIFASFPNLVLLAAFVGMGFGLAMGRRRPGLVRAALPALALLAGILAFSPQLHLLHVPFPDPSMAIWGAETAFTPWGFARATLLVIGLFWLAALIFLFAAAPVGWLFDRLTPLTAFAAGLCGSLLGGLAMMTLAALRSSPMVWMLLVVVPLLWVAPVRGAIVSAALVVAFAAFSVQGAAFSAYNRLDLQPLRLGDVGDRGRDWELFLSRDSSQQILDLSTEASAASSARRRLQAVYELPFRLGVPGGRALVVGAGTGNDLAAGLRQGYAQVVAAEIDPQVVRVGQRLHPERPYDDPRVVTVVEDARAYFERHPEERFDVVAYGLLGPHSMFAPMSALRSESYAYTVEGIRAGWSRVKDGGLLSICFAVAGNRFLADRLSGAIEEATGIRAVVFPHGVNGGTTFVAGKNLDLRRVPPEVGAVVTNAQRDQRIRIQTDDWPFMYLRPGRFPWAHLVVLSVILAFAGLAALRVYGPETLADGRFDPALFFAGAAFVLLETRLVTALSLRFGSNWVVNAFVFSGVLLTAFIANLGASRLPERKVLFCYLPLVAALLITWAAAPGWPSALPPLERGIVAGVLYALPLIFAGLVFSGLLKASPQPASGLGSSLLGAAVGGALEYTSMAIGLQNLMLLALAFTLLSYFFASRSRAAPLVAGATETVSHG